MWGQSWGQLIWGRAAAVPGVSFWGAMLLGAGLLLLGRRLLARGSGRAQTLMLAAHAFLLPLSSALAALPFSFTNGTVADANQVNSNFSALDTRVSALQAKTVGAVGVQRAFFTYTAVTNPQPSMTLSLGPGVYTFVAAACGFPTAGTFSIEATLVVNGVASDLAVLDGSTGGCFTFTNAVTMAASGTVAVAFSSAGGVGGAQGNIRWARIVASPVDSASVTTVTN
jgi:hypothetical protein